MKQKFKLLVIVFSFTTLLTACNVRDEPAEVPQNEHIENAEKNSSVSSDFNCYFNSFDLSCIQFVLKEEEKEKLNLFFKEQNEQGIINNLEMQYKPKVEGLFNNEQTTVYWTDVKSGEVFFEVNFITATILGGETTKKTYFVELTDYKNNRKLFLNNVD